MQQAWRYGSVTIKPHLWNPQFCWRGATGAARPPLALPAHSINHLFARPIIHRSALARIAASLGIISGSDLSSVARFPHVSSATALPRLPPLFSFVINLSLFLFPLPKRPLPFCETAIRI